MYLFVISNRTSLNANTCWRISTDIILEQPIVYSTWREHIRNVNVGDTKGIIKTTDIDEQIKRSSLKIKMRNLIGSTKYAPVGSAGDDLSPDVNGMKNSAKSNVMSGQVCAKLKIKSIYSKTILL